MKLWAKLISQQKIVRDAEIECGVPSKEADFERAIGKLCEALGESRPILLKKHLSELKRFSRTVFLPEDFIEPVNYDKMEIVLFSQKEKTSVQEHISG